MKRIGAGKSIIEPKVQGVDFQPPTKIDLGNGKTAKQIECPEYPWYIQKQVACCAILNDDSLYCWGSPLPESYAPKPPPSEAERRNGLYGQLAGNDLVGKKFIDVDIGPTLAACAVTDDNKLYCWGYENYNVLDSRCSLCDNHDCGFGVPVLTPVHVNVFSNPVLKVTVGAASTYVITSNPDGRNRVYMYGANRLILVLLVRIPVEKEEN